MSVASRIESLIPSVREGHKIYYKYPEATDIQIEKKMLGKRTKQYQYKKRKLTVAPSSRNPYGKGFNPKRVSYRKPPPNAELKYFEAGAPIANLQNEATATQPSYSHWGSLNRIGQGDGMNTRNGHKICIKKITLRGEVAVDRNADADWQKVVVASTAYRIVLYIDTQCNGGEPAITEFFDTDLNSQYSLGLFNRLENNERFKVLMDKQIVLNGPAAFYDGETYHFQGNVQHFKKTLSVNLPIMYSDNTTNLQAIRTNNIGLFILGSGGGGTGGEPPNPNTNQRKVTWRSRVRFTDY